MILTRVSFTGASGATSAATSCASPWLSCRQALAPKPCRAWYGEGPGVGPGCGDQNTPASSSRIQSASPCGSAIGSFDQGVMRCSRELRLHVCAAPRSLTSVPKAGFAITSVQGIGGSIPAAAGTSITYSRPSSLKPPKPFSKRSISARAAGAPA